MTMAVGSTSWHPLSPSSVSELHLLQSMSPATAARSMIAQPKKKQDKQRPPRPPVFLSTNPSHVNLHRLSQLYSSCNHSCHRFPNFASDGRIEPVDLDKLGVAVSHSSVIVSVFSRIEEDDEGEALWRKMLPLTPSNGRLIGFGRAVSDVGLTASIYDVMVIPCLRRRGIGRKIVQKIVRTLTNGGIHDIAALCSENESLFFRACGFGDDILGATTMMYSRSNSDGSEGCQTLQAGRKLLLLPQPQSFSF